MDCGDISVGEGDNDQGRSMVSQAEWTGQLVLRVLPLKRALKDASPSRTQRGNKLLPGAEPQALGSSGGDGKESVG